ncbi:NADPH:quinone reductase [Streptomyces cinnamoneus]|uniref:NADPH:quinone reductase n=1 Tax=Streptomyces cinnamoneus TaxID=53446 RepID=A0A2G1XKM0_STRCJ|nr:NADP-dependent oxidoreductase [Streptomyces cinnamoneus]PHQ51777.1 NADPH:quinone reductase [Streptomyces cinnamoneus]PPT12024.1 NADP-dependent oxidoreductase [Streptomyces cinnamoneus]
MTKIKAVAFSDYGPADVLRLVDVDMPVAGPGQVRIAVRAAGVNPLDHKLRGGGLAEVFPLALPHIPGVEAAGVVEAVGEGVAGVQAGDTVLGRTLTGAYAEQALARADELVVKPVSLCWERAAALPVAAETAWRTLAELGVGEGETLLIHGAAGGVGTLAVQLARSRGVRVIGTASRFNHEYLRGLGAIPVEYGEGLADRVREAAPEGVAAALDAVGKGDAVGVSVELTGDPGRVVTIADAGGAARHGVRFSSGAPAAPDGASTTAVPALTAALALHDAGILQLPIHRKYPLAEAAEAHRASEHGHLTGKIVLTVP